MIHIPVIVGLLLVAAAALLWNAVRNNQLPLRLGRLCLGLMLVFAVNLGLFCYWGLIRLYL